MFCPNCGRELKEGEACDCRNQQNSAAYAQQPVVQAPDYNTYQQPPFQPEYNSYNTQPATPAVAALRNSASSTLMLVFAILFSVSTLLSFVYAIYTGVTSGETNYGYYSTYYTSSEENVISLLAVIGSFIGIIPSLLVVIGTWLYHNDAKKPNNQFINPRGITFIKATAIIEIVLMSLMIFLVLIVGLVIMMGSSQIINELAYYMEYSYGYGVIDSGMIMSILVIGIIFLLAMLAVMLLFFVSFLKTLNNIKQASVTGMPAQKISMFFIVVCYVASAFSLIGCLFSGSGLTVIMGLISTAAVVIGTVMLSGLRKEMINIAVANAQVQQYAYSNAVQPNVAYQPQQPVCPVCGRSYDASLSACPYCQNENSNDGTINQ
jgi:hypothetical protein